jgi:hypothetical protein
MWVMRLASYRRLPPPKSDPNAPRINCLPTCDPMARAALLTIACPGDMRRELPLPNNAPIASFNMPPTPPPALCCCVSKCTNDYFPQAEPSKTSLLLLFVIQEP